MAEFKGEEFKEGYLYVRSDDNGWEKLCHVTDVYTDTERLAKAKKVIKQHIGFAMCGIFDTRNCAGDDMVTIYDEDGPTENGLIVEICYEWEYFEVFGLSMAEFQQLEIFYETLCKEIRAKEKETTEMKDYIVMAEHGVSCIIAHQKQEETEIRVKIVMHTGYSAYEKYEVNYKNYGYGRYSYNKFYSSIPCLGEIRDDIQHFYGAGCINVNDVRVLLDTALGVARCTNLNNALARQMINSHYGLTSANIRDCFGDSVFEFKNGSYLKPVKSTAKELYRNRGKLPEISEVIFNKPATIVKWADGTKTVVKVQGKERYNKEKGLAMAIAKKAMGNSNYYYTIMERYLEDKK